MKAFVAVLALLASGAALADTVAEATVEYNDFYGIEDYDDSFYGDAYVESIDPAMPEVSDCRS